MLLQKIQELATQNDSSEERFSTHVFSQTRTVFLGGFENDTFLLSQDEIRVFQRRAQLPGSHPACFLAVSQHWKYPLESNHLLTTEVGWTGFSLCVKLCNQTKHYEPRYSMRWASSKAIQARCFFSHLLVTKIEWSEGRISAQSVFLGGFWECHIRAFIVFKQCFLLATPIGTFTPRIIPCNVPALKMYTWVKQNLSTKEVVWACGLLCV